MGGTNSNCPSKAYLFDAVKCENCVISATCKIKDQPDREGCRFGVEDKV